MPYMRHTRELDRLASKTFSRFYLKALVVAALIGVALGVAWTIAGLLHFHPLW